MYSLNRNKLILIIAGVVLLCIIIPILLFLKSDRTDFSKQTGNKTVIIDNQKEYSSGIHPKTFSSIGTSTYVSIGLNTTKPETFYHGVIRKDSFKKTAVLVSFILDVPAAKMSWQVKQSIDNDGVGRSDALITCVAEDKLIYPVVENCTDRSKGGALTDPAKTKYVDVVKVLPLSGSSYYITYTRTDTGADALSVTAYTATGRQDALKALTSLGFSPANFTFVYIDRF